MYLPTWLEIAVKIAIIIYFVTIGKIALDLVKTILRKY
jgi:hypothetical protein